MARSEHARDVDGKSIRFGVDPVTKRLDVPVVTETHEFVQAIAGEFSEIPPSSPDYPLDACIFDMEGLRQLNLAPGWSMSVSNRAKLRNASPQSKD